MPIGGALKLKGVPINKDKYVQHNPSMPLLPSTMMMMHRPS